MGYYQKKKKRGVAIPIKGVGTFYLSRKATALLALGSLGAIIALAGVLWYIQTVQICNFIYQC